MPIYSIICKCGNKFDEIFGCFATAEKSLSVGVECPACHSHDTVRNLNPPDNMKTTNDLPKRYGIHTYSPPGS